MKDGSAGSTHQPDDVSAEQARNFALINPAKASAWRNLGRLLRREGDNMAAAAAFARSVTASLADPDLMAIGGMIERRQFANAARLLDERLSTDNDDVIALLLSGDVAGLTGQPDDAERSYRRCIALAPSYFTARVRLCRLLLGGARLAEASSESEKMLASAPADPTVRTLKAAIAASVGNHDDAANLYEGLANELPDRPELWLGLGHSQRTIGRTDAAIAAYRRAVDAPARRAEAYWSLSNLKTFTFNDDDVRHMISLANEATGHDAAFIHFALGHAFDHRGDSDRAFEAFARGNAEKRATIRYEPEQASERLKRWASSVSTEMLSGHAWRGDTSEDPIFIVGLPRSGSTLVEQILASHSLIENTAELPYMDRIATQLAHRRLQTGSENAELDIRGIDLSALGRSYLAAARAHRKTTKPFFIDKLPGNFAHVGLIKLALPNARIIDVRRSPLGTTWSVFKQLFARGQPFAYDVVEIARWYVDYVAAMQHFEAIIPGGVISVSFETLVNDPEIETRRLLEQVGVAFEPACLSYYDNGNAVRTPSSEQVRRPIDPRAAEDWRRYRVHLRPAEDLFNASGHA